MSAFTFSNGPQVGQAPTTKSITELIEAYSTLSSALHAHMQNKVDSTDVQDTDGIAALTSEQSSGYTHNIQPVLNKIVRCLQNDITRLTQAIAATDAAVAAKANSGGSQQTLQAVANQLSTVSSIVGAGANEGLRKKVADLESAPAKATQADFNALKARVGEDDNTGLGKRISDIEVAITEPDTGINKQLGDIDEAIETINGTIGNSDAGIIKDINDLQSDVTELRASGQDTSDVTNNVKVQTVEASRIQEGSVHTGNIKVLAIGNDGSVNAADKIDFIRFLNRPMFYERIDENTVEEHYLLSDKEAAVYCGTPVGAVLQWCAYESIPDASDPDQHFDSAIKVPDGWLACNGGDLTVRENVNGTLVYIEQYKALAESGLLEWKDIGHTQLILPRIDRAIIKVAGPNVNTVYNRFNVDYSNYELVTMLNAIRTQLESANARAVAQDEEHSEMLGVYHDEDTDTNKSALAEAVETHTAQLADTAESGLQTRIAAEEQADVAGNTLLLRYLQNKKVYSTAGALPLVSPDNDGNTWNDNDTALVFDGSSISTYRAAVTVTAEGNVVKWTEVV